MAELEAGAAAGAGAGGVAAADAAMAAANTGSNQNNNAGADWLPGVDGDTVRFITDKTVKDLPGLAKGYVEAQRALSQPRPIEMPKEGDVEGLKKLHAALGVPETSDKYDLGEVAKAMKPEELKAWAADFHKLGIPNKAAAGLVGLVAARAAAHQKAVDDAFVAASEAGFAKLKLEWGDDFDKNYDLTKRGISALAQQLGGITADQMKAMEQAIGTRGVHMLGLVAGRHMVEAGFVMADGQQRGLTKEGARAELQAMMADGNIAKALTNKRDPNHQKHVARKIQLENIAHS